MVCNVKHFVFERQRKRDPVGYRIYDVTRCAIERLTEDEQLTVVEGEPGEIRNETLYACPAAGAGSESPAGDLREQVEGWSGELFTDMVIGIRSRRKRAEEELAAAISDLARQGVAAFRFKDLIAAVKERGRRHWASLQDQELGELAPEEPSHAGEERAPLVPLVLPRPLFDDREAFHRLLECMAEKLARYPGSPRVREQLRALWELLKVHAAESDGDRPPPQRRVAEKLAIARGTLRQRQHQIRPLVERCREGLTGRKEART